MVINKLHYKETSIGHPDFVIQPPDFLNRIIDYAIDEVINDKTFNIHIKLISIKDNFSASV